VKYKKPPSPATLGNWDAEHRERAAIATRKRHARRKKTKVPDAHSQGTVLLMGEETKCPLCDEKMVRRRLNNHRRKEHTR